MRLPFHKLILLGLAGSMAVSLSGAARASVSSSDSSAADAATTPLYIDALENAAPASDFTTPGQGDKKDQPQPGAAFSLNIRAAALKEAALSYGARGGLAWRTYQIRKMLEENAHYLDKVYDFRQLLIAAPSGLLIEPPMISEDDNALLIGSEGQEAAVADRIYNINKTAKIVSAPRLWRNYLERDWGDVKPPPDILLPENQTERDNWIKYIREGWKNGVEQADDIYQDDLNQLNADFQGMVRYRMLLAQGMVSAPYAMQVDRGVTGGDDEMRVGDRAIRITGRPVLKTGSDEWQPASR